MKGSSRQKLTQRTFTEQVHEGKDNGYLFPKVYLADATHECMHHNPKLSSDLQGKRHTMIAVKIVSTTEAPVEFSRKLLPREISSLNTTYKHLNVGWSPTPSWNLDLVQLYEAYQSSQLVLELVAQGDLLEHINAALDHLCHPGLEEKEVLGLFWQLVSAMAHYHSVGVVYQRGRHLGRSDLKGENILLDDLGLLKLTDKAHLIHTHTLASTQPEILVSSEYSKEQADLWSLGVILYAMVSKKLPFKEPQPHCMLHLMHCGPTFWPGLFPEKQVQSQFPASMDDLEPGTDLERQWPVL
nr:LOW QUALITY PROTEIN: testis-specific serine/threonine-protein kinase 5-like [Chlorocebus sabaeus]